MRGRPGGEARYGASTATARTPVTLAAALVAAGCVTGPLGVPDLPERTPPPPIPAVSGPVDVYVAYPDSLARIAVSDSNFLFGTVGTGEATLEVNGRPVRVEPNGAFLAWLQVPVPERGDTASYRLVARAGGRVDTAVHRILVPGRPPRADGRPWIAAASSTPLPVRWTLPEEEVVLRLRAAPGVEVRARLGDLRVELHEEEEGRYRGRVAAARLAAAGGDSIGTWRGPPRPKPADGLAPPDSIVVRFTAVDGADTAHAARVLPLRLLDADQLPFATLLEAPHPVHGLAGSVAARPTPTGSYAWLLPSGSGGSVDARVGDRLRLRLGSGQRGWVDAEDLRIEARGPAVGSRSAAGVGGVSAEPWIDRVRIRVPVERRLPAHVRPVGPRSLELVVHGGLGETERMVYGPESGSPSALDWRQLPGPRWVLRVESDRRIWGWDLLWEGVRASVSAPGAEASAGPGPRPAPSLSAGGGAPPPASEPGTLVLDVRRPPGGDPGRPLRGIRVAVDPGHPPVGAEGPTGLTEADANLAVARRLVERLEAVGARPVLVRDDTAAVGLYERRRRARAAGAHLLVSIHNNALPDGLRPFGRSGTSTYYYHPHALPLARDVQRGMLASMGLRDLGVRWGDLALPRESWMPSVLAEGAFMMIPRQEAALRTTAFQDAYARGVVAGLRDFLRGVAEEAPRLRF